MTDKEILKQIKGAEKIKPYAVDTAAIRRGKANLALMMTLTTGRDCWRIFCSALLLGKSIGNIHSADFIRLFAVFC